MGFSEIAIKPIAPALKIVALMERFRPGLGIPTLALVCSQLGTSYGGGRGWYILGPMSYGKAQLIYGSHLGRGITIEAGVDLSPRWLNKDINRRRDLGEDASNLSVIFEDAAGLAGERKKLARVMNSGSWAISNLRFTDKSYHSHDKRAEAHRFNSFAMSVGMTPRVFWFVKKGAGWGDMWADRFSRLAILRSPENEKEIRAYERRGRVDIETVQAAIRSLIPEDLPPKPTLDISDKALDRLLAVLYGRQHTPARGRLYLENDLRGLAALCGSEDITREHAELYELVAPYLFVGSLNPLPMQVIQVAATGEPPRKRGEVRHKVTVSQISNALDLSLPKVHAGILEGVSLGLLAWGQDRSRLPQAEVWIGPKLKVLLANSEAARRAGELVTDQYSQEIRH